jgi:hypothetical protein
MILRSSIVLALLACTGACGGSTTNADNTDGGGGANADGGGVTLPDGGTVPTLSCGDENVTSIAGTWDIIGSQFGQQKSSAVITITASSFSFASNGESLAFAVNGGTMTLVWSKSGKQTPITATHTVSALDTGVLPLPVGGQWGFASTTDGESCTASLGGNGFNATCNDVRSTPFGTLKGTLVAQHPQQGGSIFGALGGVWHLTGEGSGSVDATIRGNTFTAVVNDSGLVGAAGWVTVKVCNGMAAGKTADGFEFAATRQ